MIRRRDSQSTHDASSDQGDNAQFPLHMDIVSDVLGSRSRYKKGFGPLPRLKAIGGKRARVSATTSSTQQNLQVDRIMEENEQLKQYMVAQHDFLKQQTQEIQEMKNMFQQFQGIIPGFNMPQHMSSASRPPPPPPPPIIFDEAITSQPSVSVHQEDDDVQDFD